MSQSGDTITIGNLGGPLTRHRNGDVDSGLAKFNTSWGYDPYTKPGTLTWMEQPTSILNLGGGSVISAMKTKVSGNTGFVYAIASNKNLYEIQVNDPNNNNANFDNPSVVGALANNVNILRGAAMVFYGATEKIFYGDGAGIQTINFDGSGSASIIGNASVIGAVPRAMTEFVGKIYFTNGNNIGEIDSTETVTTGERLSPSLPTGVIASDLDVTPDGNYLQITASRSNPAGGFNVLTSTPAISTESFKYLWNGIDAGVTAYSEYDGLDLSSSATFGDKNYAIGQDQMGAAIFSGPDKIVSLQRNISPHPTATFSVGNMLAFITPEFDTTYKASFYNYGQYDDQIPSGLFRMLRQTGSTQPDVAFVNTAINVSNLLYFPSYSAYLNDIASTGKVYFSTLESNGSSALDRGILWKFMTVPTGVGSTIAGVYETQNQLFSKKVIVKEVRLYTEPLVTGNSFTLDLIGSSGSVIAGTSQQFTVGGNTSVLSERVMYNPQMAPVYAVGVRITNASVTGTKNWTANKVELDVIPSSK